MRIDMSEADAVEVVGLQVAMPAAFQEHGICGSDVTLCALLTVTMPCGQVTTFQHACDLPDDDFPCPCGDPHHTVIKLVWTD